MIVADTNGLLALFDEREPSHDAARTIVDAEAEALVVSPFVVAELDYLLATRLGVAAELDVHAELAGGAYNLRTKSILSLDHRHFDVVRPLDGGRFKLLP